MWRWRKRARTGARSREDSIRNGVVEYRLDQFEDAKRAMEEGKYVLWSLEEDELSDSSNRRHPEKPQREWVGKRVASSVCACPFQSEEER